MFRAIFIKLRNIYNSLSKQYASLIVEHTLAIVSCYVLFMTCLSFGLFQAHLENDSQKLTHVKNSEVVENAQTISKLFPYRKNNYFTHKSIDLGHYVEIIVKMRNKNASFMNQHALDKFNQIYDNITRGLSIPAHEPLSNSTSNLTYMDNLCPKRLKICAIEGSVLRMKQFQDKLLDKKVSYNKNDPTQLYTEITLDAIDGTSMNFVFGKNREEECHNEFGKEKCYIHSVNIFRARFELLSESQADQKNAIKFMNIFEDYMDQASQSSEYHLFDISYHTSHTLEKEIVKYSVLDFKYILASFVSIWIIYFLFMWFDLRMFKVYFKEKFLTQATGSKLSEQKKSKIFSKWFKINLYMIKTSGFLVFATFIQFSLTILSTVGLMSLLSIPVNQLLYSTIFILMIINCHQSLMLFKNISDYKLKSVNQLKAKFDLANGSDKSLYDVNIKKKLTRTIQLILVPSFCTLSTSVGAYLTIGVTAQFDAIRFYCYFLVLSLIINFFGQTTFFCPCLVLYLRRVKQNRNCLLFCYKHDETENVEEFGKFDIAPDPNTDDVTIDINTENQLPRTDTQLELQSRLKKIQSNKLLNTVYILLFKKTSLFFGTKLKYLLLILFLTYLVFNLTFFSLHLRVEMPMSDLLPAQSYLKKHLDNHLAHFDLGPVVMLNFVRPFKYWELQVQQNLRNFIQECKNLPGMGQMEINWLQDVIKDLSFSKSIYEECQDEYSPACFSRNLIKVLSFDQNRDDVGILLNNKSCTVKDLDNSIDSVAPLTGLNLTIPYSRIFLSLKEFTGSQENVQTMNQLKSLATEKYNFTNQDLIIYSNVFLYLEQLNEIYPTFVAIFILSFECIYFGSLMLIFDLRTILIIQLVGISYFVSVIANMVQFGISLNIVTMMQLIIIPAFLFEFFYHQAYLFLYTVEDGTHRNISASLANVQKSMEKSIQRIKIKRLKFSFEKSSKKSAIFFLFIALFGLNFMYFCDTYNFHSLYIILMSISLNLFLHLAVVYPVLIVLIGPCWTNRYPVNSAK